MRNGFETLSVRDDKPRYLRCSQMTVKPVGESKSSTHPPACHESTDASKGRCSLFPYPVPLSSDSSGRFEVIMSVIFTTWTASARSEVLKVATLQNCRAGKGHEIIHKTIEQVSSNLALYQ